MSGEKSFEILQKIFIPKNRQDIEEIKGYSIKYGSIVDKDKVSIMKDTLKTSDCDWFSLEQIP